MPHNPCLQPLVCYEHRLALSSSGQSSPWGLSCFVAAAGRLHLLSNLRPEFALTRACFGSQSRSVRLAGVALRALAFDAVAPPVQDRSESVAALDDRQRAELAEQLGYRTIGAELPEDVSLGDVIQSMPKSVSSLRPTLPSLDILPSIEQCHYLLLRTGCVA